MTAHVALIEIPAGESEPPPRRVCRQREYARLALRECASRAGAPPSGWTQAADGRPLPNAGWHWSLSHSRGMAAAAVARSAIGVDIEHVRPRRDDLFDEIASPDEWTLLGARDWPTLFLLWTAKEATLKAGGLGIGHLPQCRIEARCGDLVHVRIAGRAWPVWHFHHHEYVMAVAGPAQPPILSVSLREHVLDRTVTIG